MNTTHLLSFTNGLKLLALFILIHVQVVAQNTKKTINVPNYGSIGYLEHLPKNYKNSSNKYPVLIFLHGAGERGNGSSHLSRVEKHGPPKYTAAGNSMEFNVKGKNESLILISPQLRSDYNSWPAFYVDLVVEHVKKTYRVDESRIYLSGLSMGGGGTWTYVSYKNEYAKKIAAILPIAGHQSFDASGVVNIARNEIATWAIHGDEDSSTPLQYSEDWVIGINKKESNLASLTVYSDVGHVESWQRGYRTDHKYHNPNAYEWLLQQRKGAPVASIPSPPPSDGDDDNDNKSNGSCNCDYTITPSNPYVNGESLGVKPGDVVCVKAGRYDYLNLFNFKGSSTKPITIKNCGGQVTIGNSEKNYGIVMNNNHHIRLTGTGSNNTKYGFKVDGGNKFLGSGFAIAGKSSDFEIDHLEITKVEAGVLAKTNPSCDASTWKGNYTMKNVKFHDFYIHDIKGEGFYIGHTSLSVSVKCNGRTKKVEPHRIENLKVYNNRVVNAGWDGIQVAQASKNCEIYNNYVYNYGTANKSSQQGGILVGGNTTGKVYNNFVKKGTGSGVQVFGTGIITIFNNIIIDAGEDAIFCDDRSPSPMTVRFVNNTIVHAKDAGIRMYSDVTDGNVSKNNLIISKNGRYTVKLNSKVKLSESNNHNVSDINSLKFNNPSKDEYQLTVSSPVINKGSNVSSYGIDEGYYGNDRPSGGQYDIGASEYPGTTNSNKPPKVDAGKDQSIFLPTTTIKFTANASDEDGNIVSYKWTKVKGPSATLKNSTSKELTITNLIQGNYTFKITVKDNKGASSSDEVKLTVNEKENDQPSNPGTQKQGLAYHYYEGSWTKLPDFDKISAKKSGTVSNFNLSPRNKNDYFGMTFKGYIQIEKSGTYKFYTASDDGSKLHINDKLIVNNDGLHGKEEQSGQVYLSKGQHLIEVSFFERTGGEILEIKYSGPDLSKRAIPNNVLYTATSEAEESIENGLNYSYYEGTWKYLPDFSKLKAIKSGSVSNFSLSARKQNDRFAMLFEGSIKIEKNGTYKFYTTSDDGSKLYINGKAIVNNDGCHGKVEKSGQVYLNEGMHAIRVEFFERTGGETLEVKYSGPSLSKRAIPANVLYKSRSGSSPEPQPDTDYASGLEYSYYEGTWNSIPNFMSMNEVKSGILSNFSLNPKKKSERFGFYYKGFIKIDKSGSYKFYTKSDDGSRLSINGKKIVDNDGTHGTRERSGSVNLSEGYHKIEVAFFERTAGQTLEVKYSGPGISKQSIPSGILFRDKNSSNARTSVETKKINSTASGKIQEEALTLDEYILKVYPVPFDEHFTISLYANEAATYRVSIADVSGRAIFEQSYLVKEGPQNLEVKPFQVSKPGIYLLNIYQNGSLTHTSKVVKR